MTNSYLFTSTINAIKNVSSFKSHKKTMKLGNSKTT